MKPLSIAVGTPRLRAASGRVKVWTREIAMRRAQGAQDSEEPTNPIYILAAITLGVPALLMIPLIGMNPGVQGGLSHKFLLSLWSRLSSLLRSLRSSGLLTNPQMPNTIEGIGRPVSMSYSAFWAGKEQVVTAVE